MLPPSSYPNPAVPTLLAPPPAWPSPPPPATPRSSRRAPAATRTPAPRAAQVVLDLGGALLPGLPAYPLPTSSIPGGVPVLGFTSLTMYDAVRASLHRNNSSEIAAVATAAHDVLVSYAPRLHDQPAAPLRRRTSSPCSTPVSASTLAGVPDGPAEDEGAPSGSARRRGVHRRAGRATTSATRRSTTPSRTSPATGSPPRRATDMLEAWLGSLDSVVLTGSCASTARTT